MADTKISALPASTTPLAGTEVLPVVQGGVTKQVSVANLTAGRAVTTAALTSDSITMQTDTSGLMTLGRFSAGYPWVLIRPNSTATGIEFRDFVGNAQLVITQATGNVTFSMGNLVQGTAAKGVNFTANTPAAGMTSQLLNWYEEGTWTPAYSASGMSGITYGTFTGGTYVRVGSVVTAWFTIYTFGTFTKGTGAVTVTGLPFTSISTTGYSTGASLSNCTRWDATPPVAARLDSSSTTIALFSNIGNTGGGADPTAVDAANMRSAAGENCNYFQGCIVYRV